MEKTSVAERGDKGKRAGVFCVGEPPKKKWGEGRAKKGKVGLTGEGWGTGVYGR